MSRIDDVTLDLLKQMLEVDPRKRISAKAVLSHPYFNTSPVPCDPKELRLLDGDSHEFLLRVQRGNKALSLKSGASTISCNSRMTTIQQRGEKATVGVRKRALFGLLDESALAPSTKESCTVQPPH